MDFKFRYVIQDLKSGVVQFFIFSLSDIENQSLPLLANVFGADKRILARNLFTGRRDSNDEVEIYDGDVVNIPYCSTPLVIKYHEGGFCAMFSNGDSHELSSLNGIQVIGNIYTNPEFVNL